MSDMVRDVVSDTTGVQPLELTSIRDAVDEPRQSAPRHSLPGMVLAVLAIALAVWATLLDTHAEVGPGPVLCAVVAIVWGLCAFSVCRPRPNELLGFLMACGATAGSIALMGATVLGRAGILDSTKSVAAAAQAFGLTLVFAVALHIVLGLPDGTLAMTARRVFVGLGYLASIGVGFYLYDQRPDLPLTSLIVLAAFDVVVGVTGFVARCQRAAVAERPRLQWCV